MQRRTGLGPIPLVSVGGSSRVEHAHELGAVSKAKPVLAAITELVVPLHAIFGDPAVERLAILAVILATVRFSDNPRAGFLRPWVRCHHEKPPSLDAHRDRAERGLFHRPCRASPRVIS